MDDSMDSASSDEECLELYDQLSKLCGSAGVHARKWLLNSERVLEEIPEGDRAAKVDLDKGNLPSVKTLGVCCGWPKRMFLLTERTHQRMTIR